MRECFDIRGIELGVVGGGLAINEFNGMCNCIDGIS